MSKEDTMQPNAHKYAMKLALMVLVKDPHNCSTYKSIKHFPNTGM